MLKRSNIWPFCPGVQTRQERHIPPPLLNLRLIGAYVVRIIRENPEPHTAGL